MNNNNQASPAPEQILFVGFNQDAGCFTCGTSHGFRIFNTYPFKDTFHREFDGGIGIVEMLYRTNIIALVGGGESPKYPPNKVMLWDDSQMKCIGELNFKQEVRAVRLRKDKIIVVLENKTYAYNFQNLKLIDTFETVSNVKGLCSMSPSKDVCVMACPDKKIGQVRIIHFDKGAKVITIDAHQSSLAALSFNNEGTILATASDKGTLIRLFDSDTGKQIQELRRGSDHADVYCISFDPVSKYLACCSDKGTIHLFSIRADVSLAAQSSKALVDLNHNDDDTPTRQAQQNNQKDDSSSTNTKSMLSFMKGVLPKYFDSEWSFAQFRIIDSSAICAIRDDKIIAISKEGNYYVAQIDAKNGGECKKLQQRGLIQEEGVQ